MAVYRHAFGIVEDEVPCGSIGGVSVDRRKERERRRIADGLSIGDNSLRPPVQVVLLLESTHALDVQRVETVGITGLIRRKFLMARLQTNATGVANPHDHHTSGLALPRFILLFGERNTDLGDWTGRRAGRILHQTALLIVNQNRLCLCAGRGRNRKATVMGRRRAFSVVHRKVGQFAVLALASQDHKTGNEDETEKNQDQKSNQQIDHSGRQSIFGAVANDKLGKHVIVGASVVGKTCSKECQENTILWIQDGRNKQKSDCVAL